MRLGLSLKLPGLTTWGGYPVPYLFQNGEQGWWYDPSDFSTLFQDAVGTTPVTAVEQPCSLMLDKRLGLVLGSNVVDDFNSLGTGWTWVGGVLEHVAGSSSRSSDTTAVVAGKTYRFTYTITESNAAASLSIEAGSLNGVQVPNTVGTFSAIITAGAVNTFASFFASSGLAVKITNISVRELPGNHAYTPAAASTARPTVSARVNLLTKTEQFDDAAWTKNATTVLTSGVLDPFGGLSAFTVTASGGGATVQQAPTVTSGVSLSASIWIRRRTGTGQITLRCGDTTAIPITVTNNWDRVLVSATPTSTGGRMAVLVTTDGDAVDIYGADLRVTNDGVGIPAYQRVNTATDYDVSGFPVYLRFDQSNDYMLTNSIDFSGTDKVTVAAGVRKASDAAQGVVIELSATIASNNGTFLLAAPDGATNTYGWDSKGTSQVDAVATSQVAPLTSVLLGLADIANDVCILQVNGVQADSDTGDQGSGNYGNFPVYIGARAGTSAFFGSRLYGTVGRGALNNDQQNAALTAYLNSNTRAF